MDSRSGALVVGLEVVVVVGGVLVVVEGGCCCGSEELSTSVDDVGIDVILDLLETVVDLGAEEDEAIIRSMRDAMLSDESVRSKPRRDALRW